MCTFIHCMKRILICVICFSFMPAWATGDQEPTSGIAPGQEMQSFAVLRDTIYVLHSGMLCYVDDHGDVETSASAQGITHLAASMQMLYGFDLVKGSVFELLDGQFEQVAQIDTHAFANMSEEALPDVQIAIVGDNAYMLRSDSNLDDNQEGHTLLCFSLESGTYANIDIPHVRAISPYRQGELLLYQLRPEGTESVDMLTAYVCDGGRSRIVLQSANTIGGVCYIHAEDRIVYSAVGEVYAIQGEDKVVPIGYTSNKWIPLDGSVFCAALVAGNVYRTVHADGTISDETLSEMSASQRVLRISGGVEDDAYAAFVDQYPDVHVINDIPVASAQDIQRFIDTDATNIDIFSVSLDMGYDALRRKGYLRSLNESSILVNTMDAYYPQIQEALQLDGAYVACPYYFSLLSWTINETLWAEVVPKRKPPATFEELLLLLQDWDAQYSEDYPNVQPIEFAGGTRLLLIELTKQYVLQQIRNEEAIHFDTPTYRNLVEQVMQLGRPDQRTIAEEDEYLSQRKLISFQPWAQFGIAYNEGQRLVPVFPAKVQQEDVSVIPVEMRMYIVNPRTHNADVAIAYLEEVAKHMDPISQAGMVPNWTDTVLYPRAQKMIVRITDQIAEKQATLKESAAPKDKGTLQDEIASLQHVLAFEMQGAYAVSEESLALYKTMAPYMILPIHSPYFGEDSQALAAMIQRIDRMLGGVITFEQCINEMERISTMIYLED